MGISVIGLIPILPIPEEGPVTFLEGWHVNSIELIEGAEAFLVTPENPYRKYQGDVPFFSYRFESEEQAAQYLPQQEEQLI